MTTETTQANNTPTTGQMSPRSCHRCKWNGKGSDICLKCPGPAEESNKGQSFVHLDAMPAPGEFLESRMRTRHVSQKDGAGVTLELTADLEQSLMLILSSFMGMEDAELVIFRHLYHGDDFEKIAKVLKVSKQCVSKRVFEMAHKHKIVTAVCNVMKRKGIGGAKRGTRRDGSFQPDLFDLSDIA